MADLIFLKLGGSLITDKTGVEAIRPRVLSRLCDEVAQAIAACPEMRLVLGHGSGSFGHVPASYHGTRHGVKTAAQWMGYAETSAAAARLNRLVTEALLEAGVPAVSLQPSASVICEDCRIVSLATGNVTAALEAGLVPVLYGDVAFDTVRGGTIISTEEIMAFLVEQGLRPSWLLLAGETKGVYDHHRELIPTITPGNLEEVRTALGGSRGADVTGGMESKVEGMVDLVTRFPHLSIRIFSGLHDGRIHDLMLDPQTPVGTRIANA